MKKILMVLTAAGLSALYSCELFLQKPDTTGVYDVNVIYSDKEYAQAILMNCYRNSLHHGWGTGTGMGNGVLAMISGERARGYGWAGSYVISETGLDPKNTGNTTNGADNYEQGWSRIRDCYLLIENVDRVPNMSREEKDLYKAEAYGLIAYRYMGMFYRYGGVPKVEKAFTSEDDLSAPRMSLEETLGFILELIQKSYDGLPAGKRADAETGRLTRGALLAMKARVLQFAARPLFNSAAPYMSLGSNNELICFGEEDAARWQDAIDANLAVMTWADGNGYRLIKQAPAGQMNTFDEAVTDYGTATSANSNAETLLQYKLNGFVENTHKYVFGVYEILSWSIGSAWDLDLTGMLTNTLEKYHKADGTDPGWPKVGDPARTGTDYETRMANMEARCRVDWIIAGGGDNLGHVGNYYFRDENGKDLASSGTGDSYPAVYNVGQGPKPVKFYAFRDNAPWTELPLFRLAETYLNLAEAYNETGNSSEALRYLNEIHLRAGLPKLTETDQGKLRPLIQRERAVELQGENFRYFDAKHWKIADIADGGLCGPMRQLQFYVQDNWRYRAGYINTYWDAVVYNSFWADYMYLEPFPQTEVNKGTVIQNPGY